MNFRVWFQKEIMKRLSSVEVNEIGSPKAKRGDEHKEASKLDSNLQAYKHLVAEEQGATTDLQKVEPIVAKPVNEEYQNSPATTTPKHDYTDNYILNVLNDLPEQWIGKEMNLHVIADRRDAAWITERVFQDVERGLITAQFTVKESNHMCVLNIVLKIPDGLARFPSAVTAINPVFSFILTDIKYETIFRRKRKA